MTRPVMLINPYCPDCGEPAEWVEMVPLGPWLSKLKIKDVDRVWSVKCTACAWVGASPRFVAVPGASFV